MVPTAQVKQTIGRLTAGDIGASATLRTASTGKHGSDILALTHPLLGNAMSEWP